MFVVPSECKCEVLLSIKYFMKEIKVPDQIIMDTVRKDKCQKKKVLH